MVNNIVITLYGDRGLSNIMANILWYIQMSNHYEVHLKLTVLYVNSISIIKSLDAIALSEVFG